MPQDSINSLPTELLCQVFDMLTFRQQMEALLTCSRWAEILEGDRYVQRRRMTLCPYNITQPGAFEDLKRYRSFYISDSLNTPELNPPPRCFLGALREFLFSEEVARNVEELQLRLFRYSLSEVFPIATTVHMPNLRRISLHPSTWTEQRENWRLRLFAPNVREVVLEDSTDKFSPLIQLFGDQLERLSVAFPDKVLFFSTIGNVPFGNLHTLTLTVEYGNHFSRLFRTTDFSRNHLIMFRQLRRLTIKDSNNMFFPAFAFIIQQAQNLQYLSLHGRDLSEEAFNAIDDLKQLEELYLMVEIHKSSTIRRLALPELRKVTTYIGTLAPLGDCPNLRTMCIDNHTLYRGRFMFGDEEKLDAYFSVMRGHLQRLELRHVELDVIFVDQICTLNKVCSLEMIQIEAEQIGIQKIMAALPLLQQVRFVRCLLRKEVFISINEERMEVEEGDQTDEGFEDQEDMDFFKLIQLQYEDCRISAYQSRVIRHTRRHQPPNNAGNRVLVNFNHFWKVY